ncbi:uncharacterized protein LOC106052387 isoform X3 [Biomphalaria glabrata]|uniref:Uncharacterized protein LOC106052387 isoform X3 n=1 Tax=Biomphalaria glabrata TaxID=6526 RepID=A0A9W3A9E8_BIOGL|nr:uncharacterized protein LOC106052387 isoform X3 [Biomphalaria glabrata]KAI8731036.1 hypothetical protein BgiMline_030661 [Biomphalaria glabrata]
MSSKRFRFLFGIFLLGTLSSLCVAEDCGGKRCGGSCCGDGLSECCLSNFSIKPFEDSKENLNSADDFSFGAQRRQFMIIFIVFVCLSVLIFIISCVLDYYCWERRMMIGGVYRFGYGPPPSYTTVSHPVQPQSTFENQYSTQYSDPIRFTS